MAVPESRVGLIVSGLSLLVSAFAAFTSYQSVQIADRAVKLSQENVTTTVSLDLSQPVKLVKKPANPFNSIYLGVGWRTQVTNLSSQPTFVIDVYLWQVDSQLGRVNFTGQFQGLFDQQERQLELPFTLEPGVTRTLELRSQVMLRELPVDLIDEYIRVCRDHSLIGLNRFLVERTGRDILGNEAPDVSVVPLEPDQGQCGNRFITYNVSPKSNLIIDIAFVLPTSSSFGTRGYMISPYFGG